jgi:lipoprotein-releasing system ATP-binding protein
MEHLKLIEARNITKSFKRGKDWIPVLRGVNLDIMEGDMIAIMGASGAGKSTLLHIIGTLDRPTGGHVRFGTDKIDLWSKSDDELSKFRNATMGFVFQFHYLLPEFTALENVQIPFWIAGQSKAQSEKEAKIILDWVGLGGRIQHKPAELSGGEQQRVAIARAIAMRPKILLADELTGNLDSENSRKIMDLLSELNRNFNVAVLLVTHDAEVAGRMKKVYQMKDGECVTS